MRTLNLPAYPFTIRKKNGSDYIFDAIRKQYLLLTPEEWVRQHFIQYLIREKGYRSSLLSQEYACQVGKTQKRCDIALFNRQGEVTGLVECKSPAVKITQVVYDQILRYETAVHSGLLIVTNGLSHYCCQKQGADWVFLDAIPAYEDVE